MLKLVFDYYLGLSNNTLIFIIIALDNFEHYCKCLNMNDCTAGAGSIGPNYSAPLDRFIPSDPNEKRISLF